jgi:hypothetical protein
VGTSDYINFKVGNNGATEAMRITTGGNVGIGTTTPAAGYKLDISGRTDMTGALTGGTTVSDGILYLNPTSLSGAPAVEWTAFAGWKPADPSPTLNTMVSGFADLDGEGDKDFMRCGWTGGVEVCQAYENTGSANSPIWARKAAWDLTPPGFGVGSIDFADIDGDGDLDMTMGFGAHAYFYRNTGNSSSPTWARNSAWDINNADPSATYAKASFADLNNDGLKDLVVGIYGGTGSAYQNTGSASSPTWTRQAGWDLLDAGNYNLPKFGDMDGDGDLDVMVGNGSSSLGYENIGSASAPSWAVKTAWNGTNEMGAIADLDNDGDLDLVTFNNSTTYFYKNTGSAASINNTVLGMAVDGTEKFKVSGMGSVTMQGYLDLNSYLDASYSGSQAAFRLAQSGTGDIVNIFDSSTEVFTILDGGNIGVGQASPTHKLHIVDTNTTAGRAGLYVSQTGAITGTGYGGFFSKTGASTTNVGLYASASGATNNYAAIFDAGNVGIGTTSPAEKLDVYDGSLILSDPDIAHGITTIAPTGAYGKFINQSGTYGGLMISGLTDDDTYGLNLRGISGATSPSVAVINMQAAKKSGTGIQDLAATEIAFQLSNNATNIITALGNGNVGIGTTAPGKRLSIQTSTANDGILIDNTGAGNSYLLFSRSGAEKAYLGIDAGNGTIIGAGADDFDVRAQNNLLFAAGGSGEDMRIASGGNVGIGTTSPGALLDVAGAIRGTSISNSDGTSGMSLTTSSYDSQYPPVQNATYVKATTEGDSRYSPYLTTDPSKSLIGDYTNNAWNATTNVNQRFQMDLGSGKVITRIYYENGMASGASTDLGAKNFTFWASNTAGISNVTWKSDADMITEGWTQITCASSQFAQHVSADQADPHYISCTNTTAYQYYAFKFADNWGNGTMSVRRIELQTSPSNNMAFTVASSERMRIDTSGNVGIGTTTPGYKLQVNTGSVSGYVVDATGAWGNSSDVRLKKNIVSMSSSLEDVMALKPVTYNMKTESNSDPTHMGFIAQDVEKISPDLVSTGPDGMKGISYAMFTPMLTKAIQEIASSVNTQQVTLNEQQNQITNYGLQITSQSVSVNDLQTEVNAKLDVISSSLASFNAQMTDRGMKITNLETKLEEAQSKIKADEDNLLAYETSVNDLIKSMMETENMLTQKILSHEDRIKALEDQMATVSVSGGKIPGNVITQDESGNVDLRGILTAKTVKADEVVAGAYAVKNSDEDAPVVGEALILPVLKDENEDGDGLNDAAGNLIVESNGTSVKVKTKAVSSNSKILVTPIGETPVSWIISSVDSGEGFTISLEKETFETIKFNWWILDEKK